MEEKLIVSKLEGSRIDKLFRNCRGETPDLGLSKKNWTALHFFKEP
jgi:hypothetical protein